MRRFFAENVWKVEKLFRSTVYSMFGAAAFPEKSFSAILRKTVSDGGGLGLVFHGMGFPQHRTNVPLVSRWLCI